MASIALFVAQLKSLSRHALNEQIICDTCRRVGHHWRRRMLDPVTTVQLFVLQILHGNIPVRRLRHKSNMNFSLTAYCNARMRLPLQLFAHLARTLTQQACDTQRDIGRWLGHRVMFVDGTGLSMPDTPALQKHFGQPHRQKPGCGFPVMHVLWMFDAATGLIVDMIADRFTTHDMTHVSRLHPRLERGDVVVGDRGFCSYVHLALLTQRQAHGVMRMHQRQIVKFGKRRLGRKKQVKTRVKGLPSSQLIRKLGRQDQVVRWCKPKYCPQWMDAAAFDALPESMVVRELRYRTRHDCRCREVTLATTLIDSQRYSKKSLADLYDTRWEIETNLRHLKQTMNLDVLRCQSVEGVLKELWVYMLVYNLVRLYMLEAAKRQRCDVQRISFIDALDCLRDRPPTSRQIVLLINPLRPGRYHPRRVKRKKDNFTYLTRPRREYGLS